MCIFEVILTTPRFSTISFIPDLTTDIFFHNQKFLTLSIYLRIYIPLRKKTNVQFTYTVSPPLLFLYNQYVIWFFPITNAFLFYTIDSSYVYFSISAQINLQQTNKRTARQKHNHTHITRSYVRHAVAIADLRAGRVEVGMGQHCVEKSIDEWRVLVVDALSRTATGGALRSTTASTSMCRPLRHA